MLLTRLTTITLLLLLSQTLAKEDCRTCFELSTDNIFLQTLLSKLLDTQISCSKPVLQTCEGSKPDCVSAQFTLSDSALGAQFTVRVAQCSVRSVWESMLYRSTLGGVAGKLDVSAEVDVDVWHEAREDMFLSLIHI